MQEGETFMKRSRIISLLALAGGVLVSISLAAAQDRELKDESGKFIIRYVVEAPASIAPAKITDPAQQVGLVLCFQEHDMPTDNDMFPVRQALIRAGKLDQYVLLAAAPQTRKFGPADNEPIEKLLAWAKKTYPINPRRVYTFGKGEGSKISMEFMMAHPNLITAAIGYSWGAWLMPSEITEPIDFVNSAPEIYLTLGRRDLAHHLTCVRDAYLRLKAKGYHVINREFDELNDRSYHQPSNDDALAWATRLRNKLQPLSMGESKILQAHGGSPKPVNGYYPGLALVGGAQAGAVLEKLFASKDEAVRAAAAETCKHAIFGAPTTAAVAKLAADPSPKVRQSAMRALAMYANWRYPAAQQALIAVATDVNASLSDRINAADGLGYAVRFQAKGVRQDPAMFAALVALSQDKHEHVRAPAVAALAPAYEPPPAGAPRRRGPEGGWEKWLNEISSVANADLQKYEVCGSGKNLDASASSFCAAGAALLGRDWATGQPRNVNLSAAFQGMKKAAGAGYVPAQAALAMMYATGKGVKQNYEEAVQWWMKAAEGGDLASARYAWNIYRNGEGVQRNPANANKMAVMIGEPVQQPRAPRNPAPPSNSVTQQ
jgi:hypothetical protein